MKKRKKITLSQKLERKLIKANQTIRVLDRRAEIYKNDLRQVNTQKDVLIEKNAEQERIINMFKSCIDKTILEKILKDDYVRYLIATNPIPKNMFDSKRGECPSFKYETNAGEGRK